MHTAHYQDQTIKWCRYSDYAHKNLHPGKPYRFGRLLRKGYSSVTPYSNGHPYAIVRWNGNKVTYRYHSDFIEVFAETDAAEITDIPKLPVWPHLLRSLAWRAA